MKISSIQNFLSFIFPIRLKTYSSAINGPLEINLVNGKKMLDTEISNYSFGSLQKILREGLRKTGTTGMESILLLGLGGGSVIASLREEFGSNAEITALELDPQIIDIAKNEFHIEKYANLKIIEADAVEFVNSNQGSYDLIIVDLFVGNEVPEVFTQAGFIDKASHLLSANGKVIYNTMAEIMPEIIFLRIQSLLMGNGLELTILKNLESSNHLIIATKQNNNIENDLKQSKS